MNVQIARGEDEKRPCRKANESHYFGINRKTEVRYYPLQNLPSDACIAAAPLDNHSLGDMRSSRLSENRRLFSGTNAHSAGSGGGVEVIAFSSLPVGFKS